MHHKAIKAQIRKQLKTRYPNWQRLNKKQKKAIAKRVLEQVVENYDFNQEVITPVEELLGIEAQLPTAGIMDLGEMARFIESHKNSVLFKLNRKKRHPLHLKDQELRFIDDLLDNQIINKLLSYDGYTPAMRELYPSSFLRAELLKAVKYPEVSYRKFCGDDKDYKGHKENSPYIGMDNKQNRAFIGLALNRKQMLSHVQMCQFRASLTFAQLVNLTVYILHNLRAHGILDEGFVHCVDSSELPIERQQLLASLTIKGKKIRIYDDIDCDCGKRRKKRDKSVYVVGYRMHSLTAINPKTGHSIPLISLLAPANHHDSLFLTPLVKLAKAIGLDLKLITADEAYNDTDGSLFNESGVHLIKPPDSKVCLPANVDAETLQVMFDDLCDTPMKYVGIEDQGHEFKCDAQPGQCLRSELCPKFRHIAFDNGCFQRIFYGSDLVSKALEIRKNGERPFNLLKKREGLEQVRVRSQHGIVARTTFTTMATLLLEMAGTRRTKKEKQNQMELPLASNF
jgi:hypothetical protein